MSKQALLCYSNYANCDGPFFISIPVAFLLSLFSTANTTNQSKLITSSMLSINFSFLYFIKEFVAFFFDLLHEQLLLPMRPLLESINQAIILYDVLWCMSMRSATNTVLVQPDLSILFEP